MTTQHHNRLNEILRVYWESILSGRSMPEEKDIEPSALKEIWDACFLVRHVSARNSGAPIYRYDYLGDTLINAFGSDVSNQDLSARLVDSNKPPLFSAFSQVLTKGIPVEEEGEFTNDRGLQIRYRCSVFPLGNASHGIEYFLGGMKWKFY